MMRQRGFFAWSTTTAAVVGIVGALWSQGAWGVQRGQAALRALNSPTSLGGLSTQLQGEEKATFKAVYLDHPVTGPSSTLTFEQRAPDWLVKLPGGNVLTIGGKSYFCASEAGHPMCFVGAAASYDTLIDIFNPAVVVSELQALEREVSLKTKGVTVHPSSKTIAGQTAQCETVTVKTGSSTWCVLGKGFLAYSSTTGGASVTLESYTTSVPASDFNLPAGAKVETVSGPSSATPTAR